MHNLAALVGTLLLGGFELVGAGAFLERDLFGTVLSDGVLSRAWVGQDGRQYVDRGHLEPGTGMEESTEGKYRGSKSCLVGGLRC